MKLINTMIEDQSNEYLTVDTIRDSFNEIDEEEDSQQVEMHDLYTLIGPNGKFQVKIISMICLCYFFLAFYMRYVSFIFTTPVINCPIWNDQLSVYQ